MFPQSGSTNMIINLTGIKESIFDILGYSNDHEKGIEIIKNVIKTANDVVSNFDKKNYDHFGISIVNDNSSSRFVQLDSERFGKLFHTFRFLFSRPSNYPKRILMMQILWPEIYYCWMIC